MKTTAKEFYQAIKHIGAGSLYYLVRKKDKSDEFVFEPLVIDTKDEDLTIKILQRTIERPDFIAFPGTPEAYEFMNEVVDPNKKSYLYIMTITFTQEHLYVGIIVILVLIQLYQQKLIKKLEKECDDIWSQLGTLVGSVSNQIISLQKDINDKQDKK